MGGCLWWQTHRHLELAAAAAAQLGGRVAGERPPRALERQTQGKKQASLTELALMLLDAGLGLAIYVALWTQLLRECLQAEGHCCLAQGASPGARTTRRARDPMALVEFPRCSVVPQRRCWLEPAGCCRVKEGRMWALGTRLGW